MSIHHFISHRDSAEECAGDYVCVDGKYNVSEKDGRTFYNLTANKLAVVAGEQKAPREIANQQQSASSTAASPF